ncbi:MAG: hypothetical protein KGJ21_08670, partial [Pseudomonadota bacterium]|nr:hypothetical protein [Pseudomonadota bacterium]
MRIERHFTKPGQPVYDGIAFKQVDVVMKNPDGSVVFEARGTEVPEAWSQVACDVIAQKYFRKAGVARALKKIEENAVPSWLWRSEPNEEALAALPEENRFGGETSS